MKLIFFTYLLLSIELVLAQNPCRVNVIFGLDASNYAASDGDSAGQAILFNEISNLQSTYRSWTISPNSVRAAIPRPMGCSQGGNWTLQDDVASLDNVVNAPPTTPYYCPSQFKANVLFELDVTDCTNFTASQEVKKVLSIINSWTIGNNAYKLNLPDPIGLVNFGMDFGNYTAQNSTVYSTLQSFIVGASQEAPCLHTEPIISVIENKNYPDFGIPHPIVLFTRASQPNDVSGAIAYRKQHLDPYNVRLYVVSVNATANLTGLASNGIAYDINDPNLSNYINGDICSTPGLLPSS
uniref:Uncharacterized protein n=1 Tax=Acrobeloides nanus TaxID=290746 RepID=A0A914E9D9_9BILA